MVCLKIIGITGQSGSGKSFFSGCFSKYNSLIYDLDKVVHDLYKNDVEFINLIASKFDNVVNIDGSINRTILGNIVFNDPDKLSFLNSIVHPYVVKICLKIMIKAVREKYDYLIFDAPQLFESGLNKICDITVGILADKDVRKKRILARDKLSEDKIELRMKNQKDDAYYIEKCDLIFYNNDILSEFKINDFLEKVLE